MLHYETIELRTLELLKRLQALPELRDAVDSLSLEEKNKDLTSQLGNNFNFQ